MKFEVYQIVVPLISLAGAGLSIRQYRNGNNTIFETFLWCMLWIFIAVVAIFPNKTTLFLSRTIGIKDHINAIIFIGLAISFFLNFKMFNTVKKMNRQITELVRKISIESELRNRDKS